MRREYLIVLGLSLVVSEQARLEHEIAHVDVRPSDLSPTVSDHPSFVYYLRRRRHRFGSCNLSLAESFFEVNSARSDQREGKRET